MSAKELPLAERIEEIDVTAVDGLSRVRREREVLEGRLESLEERREKVSRAVYDRVRGDYHGRLAELEREAEPLGIEARREYAKLEALRREVEEAEERVRLDKEEVELRHELGELDKKDFDARSKDCVSRLEERRAELEKVEKLRSRFLEAVRSEEELLEPASDASPEEAPASAEEAPPVEQVPEAAMESPPDEAGEAAPGVADAETSLGPSDAPPDDAGEAHPEATVLLSTDGPLAGGEVTDVHDAPTGMVSGSPAASGEGAPAEPEGGAVDELAGATRILSRPRMMLLDGEVPGEAFFLGPKTVVIGRAAGNAIQLLEEAISRRHAEIRPGPEGFVVHDLGSENGTYINGERIDTHPLREGDVVQIGPRRLVFREA